VNKLSEPVWDTSCRDWETRIVNRQSLVPFPPLFPDEAEACLQVLNDLRIVDAPGSPLIGESCAPWISDLAGAIFGAYNSNTGERLIQEFFLLISKKNAKSTIAAAIMLTVLIRNWRQSAEFIILAPTIEVANNAYAPARDMVKHDEELSALLHVQDHVRTITHRESGATLKVVAADQNTVGGKKAAVVLVDELHLFGKNPHAANMLREATGGLASRPEGFVIYLTTQSDQPPAGVFREKLQYARGVRDGTIIDPNFLPVIYEFPKKILEGDDHRKPENFYITNPNMGYSVSEKFLIREMKKAEEAGEAEVLGFMSKHLNVEIGLALRSDRWAGADYWVGAAEKRLTLDDVIARCDVIDIGIDGGGLDDLLGFAAVGRDKRTRDWLVWTHAWAHPSVLERRKAEAPRFHDFEKDGDLTLSKRIGDDVLEVADLVEQVEESGLLDKVGVDPVGIGAIYDAMIEREIPPEKIVAISQGWKLGGAIKTAERKLAEGGMKHGGQPMMAWCVSNAKVEPRANSILITKQASGSAKIDPLMALFNAVTLISLNPEGRGNDDFMAAIRNPIIV
jgi:phage terminase large subunit-like protein